ncbi:hypothetical protein SmJEL517_g01267 [Synchytrium microbalum]|uniref:Uncharacterized protein n=1 Tax=Synchytrium microbalum TaxID=1806994 RepID=A0A507CC21_9FUNG|nr:uncharacterized protein SmJEL517_g01267 [Synchytrium microbalum]TPX36719.1 hypothetical protein SmJEL517_g01267 [Synchytrium microbalum]
MLTTSALRDESVPYQSPRKQRRAPASSQKNYGAALIDKCQELKVNVYGTINSNYRDYLNTSNYVLDLRDEIASVAEQVEQARAYVDDHIAPSKTALSARTLKTLEDDLQVLGILSRLHYEVQNFDHLVNIGEFVGAAASVAEMTSLIETLQDSASCDKSVFDVIKGQIWNRRATLKYRLNELFCATFSFTCAADGMQKVSVSQRITSKEYFDSPPTIEDLFAALATAEMLQEKLIWLAQNVVSTIIKSILKQPGAELTQSRNKLHSQLIFSGGKKAPASDLKRDLPLALDKIVMVGEFMLENGLPAGAPLGDDPPSYAESFGEAWSELLYTTLIEDAIIPIIPDDKSSLERFSGLAERIATFDLHMKELELIPTNREDLVTLLANLHSHYTRKRRNELLRVARDILSSDDTNTVQVTDATERGGLGLLGSGGKDGKGGESRTKQAAKGGGKEGLEINNSALKLPTMHISVQAQMLIELVYQTLNESIQLDDQQSAVELFFCARDLVDLYRAIMPQHIADLLEPSPTRAMVFYCDCTYIVHHLLTMGFQYAPKLPPPITSCGTFVDLVPSFRKLGDYYFRNQLRHQRDVILNQLGLISTLGDLSNDARFKSVETGMKHLVHHITAVAKSWKAILPYETALQAIGLLVDTTLSTITETLLALTQLSVEDTYQLKYLMGLVLRLEGCFHVVKLDGKQKTSNKAPIPKYCKSWEPFVQLISKLDIDGATFLASRSR